MQNIRPSMNRGFTSNPGPPSPASSTAPPRMHVKRATLTSKKNWWLVEMDQEEEKPAPTTEETTMDSIYPMHYHHHTEHRLNPDPSPPPSPPIYNPPRLPTAIFSFPIPTAYCAQPNPTASLAPYAQGSASELFKCVVKKPDVVALEINGEMQSNASDVTVQFLAELRVYTTLSRHRNICVFLGALVGIGIVLEFIDGRTLYDVIVERPELSQTKKIDYHNQLLDGLTHLHSHRLSHGDLSLLNIQVTVASDTLKLLDFGRSVSADSIFKSPDDETFDPFRQGSPSVEQIHPGTRPFAAPEILRGECQDPLLADAYSFGMILVCLDRCVSVDVKPWDQRKDLLPKDLFDGCTIFTELAQTTAYLRKWNDSRKRLSRDGALKI
ncbi:kinase-like domain-containing protein [Mycena floridula]|nr:kinase-like domain-containing protein [Mycena floridula]